MAQNGCPLNVLHNEPAQFAPNETLLRFPCDAGTTVQGALSLPPPPRVQQGVLVQRAPTVRRGPSSPCSASLAPTPPPRTPLGASAVRRAGTAFRALFACVPQVRCKQQQQTTKQQQPSNQFAFCVPIYWMKFLNFKKTIQGFHYCTWVCVWGPTPHFWLYVHVSHSPENWHAT